MRRIIAFKRNDTSDLYWFDDKTNEKEFIITVKNVKGMKCSNVLCDKDASYILDGVYYCKDHYPNSWQNKIIEMTKDEPLGGIFTKSQSKPGHEKQQGTDKT